MPTDKEKIDFLNTIIDVVVTKELTYLEAIAYYCENNDMEMEIAITLIGQVLKEKIQEDAETLNLLKKTAKLPI